jgi:hypothetical protein
LRLYRHCHRLFSLWAALSVPVLSACAAQPMMTSDGVPAVLAQPDVSAHAELRSVVARMLGAPDVTLASDVLLHDSLLVIEKARPRDAMGVLLNGRDYDKPEQFELVKSKSECVLVRVKTGERQALRHATCIRSPK